MDSVVSGGSYALQQLEDTLDQDLNGDGTTGIVTSEIEDDGLTTLLAKADQFFLDDTGPALKFQGSAVTAGQFGAWAPIGAEASAGGGFDVAWKFGADDQYTTWHTDGAGNVTMIGDVVPGAAPLAAGARDQLRTGPQWQRVHRMIGRDAAAIPRACHDSASWDDEEGHSEIKRQRGHYDDHAGSEKAWGLFGVRISTT